jgi:hypothetical protein
MRFAIVNGLQIEPFPRQRANCPCCGRQLVAKCGSVKVWHWSHFPEKHCDNWWENETEWHRKWKNYFPSVNQEIVHHDNYTGEKHIADVKTNDGIVVELQNSPMNENELVSREQFYKNMIWVVNGTSFKKHFTIFPFNLPPPNSPLADDLYIFRPPYIFTNSSGTSYMGPIIAKKSEIERDSGKGYRIVYSLYLGRDGRLDTSEEFQKEIDTIHDGHYHFTWKNQRKVWYKATKPVFIDFGDHYVVLLQKINSDYYGVKLFAKAPLIKALGGKFVE